MFAMFVYYFAFLNVIAQCHWTGFFMNKKLVPHKIEFIKERPDEDVVSIFSTF